MYIIYNTSIFPSRNFISLYRISLILDNPSRNSTFQWTKLVIFEHKYILPSIRSCWAHCISYSNNRIGLIARMTDYNDSQKAYSITLLHQIRQIYSIYIMLCYVKRINNDIFKIEISM